MIKWTDFNSFGIATFVLTSMFIQWYFSSAQSHVTGSGLMATSQVFYSGYRSAAYFEIRRNCETPQPWWTVFAGPNLPYSDRSGKHVMWWLRDAFAITGPLWEESIGHYWIPLTNGKTCGALFPLLLAWTSSWTIWGVAGDLRHYDKVLHWGGIYRFWY